MGKVRSSYRSQQPVSPARSNAKLLRQVRSSVANIRSLFLSRVRRNEWEEAQHNMFMLNLYIGKLVRRLNNETGLARTVGTSSNPAQALGTIVDHIYAIFEQKGIIQEVVIFDLAQKAALKEFYRIADKLLPQMCITLYVGLGLPIWGTWRPIVVLGTNREFIKTVCQENKLIFKEMDWINHEFEEYREMRNWESKLNLFTAPGIYDDFSMKIIKEMESRFSYEDDRD